MKESKVIDYFLRQIRHPTTRNSYRKPIEIFFESIGKDPDEYVKNFDEKQFRVDLLEYATKLDNMSKEHKIAPKTIRRYIAVLKRFCEIHLLDMNYVIFKNVTRTLPKARTITHDSVPTKKQLKQSLDKADTKIKTLVLFLSSSGLRVGEALSLKLKGDKLEDGTIIPHIEKYEGYWKINVPAESKGHYSRIAFISKEAGEYLDNWISVERRKYIKRARGKTNFLKGKKVDYDDERLFPYWTNSARSGWNHALDKSGNGQRCPRTKHHIFHIHTLRKYFKSNLVGRINQQALNILIGHETQLDRVYQDKAYEQKIKWLFEEYKKGEGYLTVYTSNVTDDTVKQLQKQIQDRNKEIELTNGRMKRFIQLQAERSKLERKISNGIPPNEEDEIYRRLDEIDKELETLL